MATHQIIQQVILIELQKMGECEMEALLDRCSGFTWSDVISEVDRLSRVGKIRLKKQGLTGYALALGADNLRGARR